MAERYRSPTAPTITPARRSCWCCRCGKKTCVNQAWKERVRIMSKNGSLMAPEVLVVDDEEDIRDLIAGILRDEGYDARVAADSDSTFMALRQRRPHLV